jgi:Fe-S-cluster containining protein
VNGGPEYDCQTCGACCVQFGPYDGNAYVYLDGKEAADLRRLGLPVVEGALGSSCLGARPHDGAGGRPACVAFTGTLGGRCGCSVYEVRPSVCREYEVGGLLCRQAREQAGLPV